MSDQPQDPQGKPSLKIVLDEQTAQGRYANLAMVSHGESEFILDFMFLQPGRGEARVNSRVIMSPRQAKRLLSALTENVGRFERRFGTLPDEDPGDIVH